MSGVLAACGGDDQFIQPGGTTDGGKTDGGNGGDGGKTDGGDGGTGTDGSMTDGGPDSGCPFTDFVITQVKTGISETASPVPNAMIPDPTCSLDAAAPFSSLFP